MNKKTLAIANRSHVSIRVTKCLGRGVPAPWDGGVALETPLHHTFYRAEFGHYRSNEKAPRETQTLHAVCSKV